MSEFIHPPNPEDALLAEDEADRQSTIASGLYRHRVSVERLSEYHTGGKDSYLSYAEEAELANAIQDGLAAKEEADHLQAEIETMDEVTSATTEQLMATLQRIKRGRHARQKLIEANLRYASYLARASIGIVTPPSGKAVRPTTSDRYKGKNKQPRKTGTYTDIRNLRSPYAQLEDRMQAAYIGLVKAAESFLPQKKTKKDGQQPSFVTYAAWHIQREIELSTLYEATGYRLPINVATDVRKYERRKYEVVASNVNPTPTDNLEAISQGVHALPIHELHYLAASEETDAGTDEQDYIGLEELLPDEQSDDPFEYIQQSMLEGEITKVLSTVSEREAGVVRLRFGLVDGKPKTLDEIGMVYGLSRERVNQILKKTLSKLRHPSRTELLVDFLDNDVAPDSLYWSAETVRIPHKFAHLLGDEALKTNVKLTLEVRELTEEDDWPDPSDEAEVCEPYEVVEARFTDLILRASPHNFQQSFAREVDSLYPKGLIDAVEETLGKHLTPAHIEQFWNTHLGTLIDKLQQAVGEDLSFDRLGQLFSALLAERMTDDDAIALNIPPNADGKLNFLGAWLQNGRLTINGNAGEKVAYKAKGLAEILISGNAGDYAGTEANGYAAIIIMGDAGDMLGYQAGGECDITVRNNAGDFAASALRGQATVVIEGNVGDCCACEIKGQYTEVKIGGNAGVALADQAIDGTISVVGSAESYSPKKNFTGRLYIGGKEVQISTD